MKTNSQLLADVRIASPCQARWEDMEGDDRTRFCRHCSKYVYNLSKMTSQAAADLIREREGQLCARFYQRRDGTMLTADCPVGLKRPLLWMKEFVSAAAACFCLVFPSFAGEVKRGKDSPAASVTSAQASRTNSAQLKLGEVCFVPPTLKATDAPRHSTNTPPFLGKIAISPPRPAPAK
jgi:hypothetical protein